MRNSTIINQRNGNIVSLQTRVANTWIKRLVGLLPEKKLNEGDGLWIQPCSSIHTIGMRFPIDVVFLDKNHRIKKLGKSVKPFRFCASLKGTKSVLELPVGSIVSAGLQRGDKLLMQ